MQASSKLIITLENQGYLAVLREKLAEIMQYSVEYATLSNV